MFAIEGERSRDEGRGRGRLCRPVTAAALANSKAELLEIRGCDFLREQQQNTANPCLLIPKELFTDFQGFLTAKVSQTVLEKSVQKTDGSAVEILSVDTVQYTCYTTESLNQTNALRLIRSKASQRYHSAKAEALLKFLAQRVTIWRNGKKDANWDIENRWQELKLSTVLDGITVTESYFYRLMPKVADVVQSEVKHKRLRYRLNLEPLRQFHPQPRPTDSQRREKKLRQMREQYAVNREKEKREELLQFLRPHKHLSVADLMSIIEQQGAQESNSLKGANEQQ